MTSQGLCSAEELFFDVTRVRLYYRNQNTAQKGGARVAATKIFLFGDRQKNSRGEDDFWEFSLQGDRVSFEFRSLFDADEDEITEGSGEFERHIFSRWLEERLSGENCGELKTQDASVDLEKRNGQVVMITMRCYDRAITVPFDGMLSPETKQRLGIQ